MGEGLTEIRAKGQEGIGRAFFCTGVSQEIVVLHAFIKKTQKTLWKELTIARVNGIPRYGPNTCIRSVIRP
jgi:phage-related protein